MCNFQKKIKDEVGIKSLDIYTNLKYISKLH